VRVSDELREKGEEVARELRVDDELREEGRWHRRRPGHGVACLHWCGDGDIFLFLSEDLLSQHYVKTAQTPILCCRQNEASKGIVSMGSQVKIGPFGGARRLIQ
jgi:hypothetical protein